MKDTLKINLITLPVLLVCASCAVPLRGYTVKSVMSERLGVERTPTETIVREAFYSKSFYPVTGEGYSATESWPHGYNYFLVDNGGKREKLSFLTKKHMQGDYFVGIPISNDRWIAITLPNKKSKFIVDGSDLHVFVFKNKAMLFSQTIKGSFHFDLMEPRPEDATNWKPITGNTEYRSKSFIFDSKNEEVTFKSPSGDVVFNPADGTLRKVTRD